MSSLPSFPQPPGNLRAMFSTIHATLAGTFPGAAEVYIGFTVNGKPFRLPVPPVTCPEAVPRRGPPGDEEFIESEREILQAVDELGDGQFVNGEELAELVGVECGTRFRELVARLVRLGRIRKTRAGYSKPAPSDTSS